MMRPFRLLLIGLLLLVLLFSILLNLYLFRQARGYYLQLNEVRLNPLGLNYYPLAESPTPADAARPRIVFFGDSRAASWPAPDLPQFEFLNRGIGAQTTAQTLYRLETHLKPLHPQIVIVQVGINDLKTLPLFPERREIIVADCQANIRQIVAASTDMGAVVILTTIFPTDQASLERRFFWSPDVALAVEEVNGYIHSLEGPDVIIFDAYEILADKNGVTQTQYALDLLYLNEAGYQVLNQALTRILMSQPFKIKRDSSLLAK